VGGKWDISNKQRIGFTEVQLVQKMIDGVKKLIALEEELVASGVGA
jgi:creatine kinase